MGDFGRPFNTEVHVSAALRELGHEVLEVPERGLDWSTLPIRARRRGLVLWTHSLPGDHAAQLRALGELRDAGVGTVSFHLDRWWGLSLREAQVREDPFFRTDLVVTADGGHADRFQAAGVRHMWLPPAVHGPEVGRGIVREGYRSDVAFVGGAGDYPHPEWRDERGRLIQFLRDRYGDRFRLWPESRARQIRGRELNDLYASVKVVVGDSCLAGAVSHYWSDRIPETLGRGGFLVHPHVEGLEDWYRNGEHLVTFDLGNLALLGASIDAALEDPEGRQEITANALKLVAERDTYRHRLEEVLGALQASPVRAGWADGRAGAITVSHQGVAGRFELRGGTTDGTVVREVWQQGSYRIARPDVADRVVVDVGAHVGSFTVLAAKLGAAQVIAVEPSEANRARLEAHLVANRVADRVRVLPYAVSDAPGPVSFLDDGSSSHITAGGGARELVTVEARPLAELLADVEAVAVLKVDCEGGEYLSLASLAQVLPRVDQAVFEFHGPRMPHMEYLTGEELGPLVVVLAELGVVEVQGRPSTGGMIYWRRHR